MQPPTTRLHGHFEKTQGPAMRPWTSVSRTLWVDQGHQGRPTPKAAIEQLLQLPPLLYTHTYTIYSQPYPPPTHMINWTFKGCTTILEGFAGWMTYVYSAHHRWQHDLVVHEEGNDVCCTEWLILTTGRSYQLLLFDSLTVVVFMKIISAPTQQATVVRENCLATVELLNQEHLDQMYVARGFLMFRVKHQNGLQ